MQYPAKPLLLILSLAFVMACNFEFPVNAGFTRHRQEIVDEIMSLVNSESVSISSHVHHNSQGKTSTLRVNLVNSSNLPAEAGLLDNIGREVIQVVISSIDNAWHFDEFSVVFQTIKRSGFVKYSTENTLNFCPSEFEDFQNQ